MLRSVILAFFFFLSVSGYSEAPQPTPPAAHLEAVATPIPTPSPAAITAMTENQPVSLVPAPAAPPEWAQEIMVAAEKLPVVGPILSKLLLWLGIVLAIITTVTGCLLSVINTLKGVFNLAGLLTASTALQKFLDGPVVYWLKFFSAFNAKKSEKPTGPTV